MSERKKQAVLMLVLSVPLLYFGFINLMTSGGNPPLQAIGIALACTLGSLFSISGLVMLATKNSLGIWDSKSKAEKKKAKEPIDEETIEKYDRVTDTILHEAIHTEFKKHLPLNKERKKMPKKQTTVGEKVKRFRELGQTKKDINSEQADLKAELKAENILIDEDGKLEVEEE